MSLKGNHARQRSADRDANDILPGGRKVQVHAPLARDAQAHRATTPKPRATQNHCDAPTRRATTPSAELGRDGKPAIVHFRQPSYLIAVDGKENNAPCTCSGVAPPVGGEVYCDYDCVDGPRHEYAAQANGRPENGIGLHGSLPADGRPANTCYRTPPVAVSTQGGFGNHVAVNAAIHSRVAEFVHTPSPMPTKQNGYNSQTKNSTPRAPNQCLYTTNTRYAGYRAQDMSNGQQLLHRSGSLEDIDLPPDGVSYTTAQQSRPQSARPFDHRNSVKSTAKHPTGYSPRCTNGNGETRPMNKMAAWMMSSDNDASDEMYINSKAVQSILNYQRVRHQMHPATRVVAQQGGRSSSPVCTTQLNGTASPAMTSRDVHPRMTQGHRMISHYHHGDSADKTSLRSTDSVGDRNSASSAASALSSQDSLESTKASTRHGVTTQHRPSTDSTTSTCTSTSTSASVLAMNKQRLMNIHENRTEMQHQGMSHEITSVVIFSGAWITFFCRKLVHA